ncbi:GNAT family N-acetyltransferase [Aquimarina sp. 2201CG14-23]|uniref:GNAT family N-acetyltransferase n=1 Tax=Aquimarina mycalae TaxID=3040073 RepID=UPI0024782630|nr:GNAT family N-acetyltransferase [Aquimarina sp. 2201CG14-23]MDH7445701.1 GNAT family N-acetyltransferase [Aquimarina sp. 2201CG14-23]
MFDIKLIPEKNIEVVLPLLQELNNKIPLEELKSRLREMISSGYECVGVYDKTLLVGISGMWFLTKYYIGRHVEPDNVYVLPEYQGKGIGKLLMNWIFEYAKSKGCIASELNVYTGNKAGQQFWENLGYERIAFHYQKKL